MTVRSELWTCGSKGSEEGAISPAPEMLGRLPEEAMCELYVKRGQQE